MRRVLLVVRHLGFCYSHCFSHTLHCRHLEHALLAVVTLDVWHLFGSRVSPILLDIILLCRKGCFQVSSGWYWHGLSGSRVCDLGLLRAIEQAAHRWQGQRQAGRPSRNGSDFPLLVCYFKVYFKSDTSHKYKYARSTHGCHFRYSGAKKCFEFSNRASGGCRPHCSLRTRRHSPSPGPRATSNKCVRLVADHST